jgi:predicted nuclease of predicted toxin-antitoxin system
MLRERRSRSSPKDADFRQRSFLEGFPPKIVLLQLGNCSTKAIEVLLRNRAGEIQEFLDDEQKSVLVLR